MTIAATRPGQRFTDSQHEALSKIADFDHIFAVLPDGTVADTEGGVPLSTVYGLHAPDAHEPDVHATTLTYGDATWSLPLSGLTGQYGYSGPWLHDSEMIVGGVAERVLSTPGLWVAIYATFDCDDDDHQIGTGDHDECDTITEGWTLAHRPFPAAPTSTN